MKIETKDFYNKVIMIDIAICLYIEILKCYFGFAQVLNFVPDILNFCTILLMLKNKRIIINKRLSSVFGICFLIIISMSFFYGDLNIVNAYQRYRYILFGFITFYLCSHYLKKERWLSIVNFLYVSQIIHTLLVFYQFFVMKIESDYANGIFGFVNYNNGMQGLYCVIMSIIGLEFFIKKVMPTRKSISMIIFACITCALSEIKAFYVILIVASAFIIIFNSKKRVELKKLVFVVLVGIIGVYAAYRILLIVNPGNLVALTGMNNWLAYEQFETLRAGGYGRGTQLTYCYDRIFNSSFASAFLGKGLAYNNGLLVYQLSAIFANFGILGLALFFLFLISVATENFKNRKTCPEAMISCTMCLVILISLVVWGDVLNRTSLLVFVLLSLGSTDFVIDRS